MGVVPESMPRRHTPRRMKGATVVLRLMLAARPIAAMVPPVIMVLAIQASTSPPRLSTAPAQVALSSGLIFERSRLFLDITSLAPRFLKYPASLSFPVNATTLYPRPRSEERRVGKDCES